MQKFIIFSLIIVLVLPSIVFARIGVGTATSEIKVDEPLKAGGIYILPSVRIINTGDEPSDYGIGIAYDVDRPLLRPVKEWFSFDPSPLFLEPGQSQAVAIKLTLPLKIQPGDYFCYLESGPVVKTEYGTRVGMSVGTRLFFTVAPANIWQAVVWRVSSFFAMYSPWTWVVLGMVLAAVVIVLFRKRFAFQIRKR